MARIINGYDFTGKSLIISASKDGFRRGGIAHTAKGVMHSADEFSDEQLGQIMAESGKNLIVQVVEVKGMEGGSQPPAVPEDALDKVKAAISELEMAKEKVNVANLSFIIGRLL